MLVTLRKGGIIDGRDYIGGFELGAEVAGGAGSLTIDHLGHAFEKYTITSGADGLIGTGHGDLIDGRGGADVISGLAGTDDLRGGAGRDRLSGGPDADRLEGAPGSDSFVFDAALGPGNVDRIADMKPGKDAIVLDADVFAGLASGPLPGSAFHAGKVAHDTSDRILHDAKRGTLAFDADGTGGDDAVVFARIDRGMDVSAGDLYVVRGSRLTSSVRSRLPKLLQQLATLRHPGPRRLPTSVPPMPKSAGEEDRRPLPRADPHRPPLGLPLKTRGERAG